MGATEGFIDKVNGRWAVYCSSSKCLPAHIMKAAETANVRELTATGLIIFPRPDNAGMALIKGCAGARWCPSRDPYPNPNTDIMIQVPEGRAAAFSKWPRLSG